MIMTDENRQKLKEMGAVRYYCYMQKSTNRFGITRDPIVLTELKHFFNKEGKEIAMLVWSGSRDEMLDIFDTPREWGMEFFKQYKGYNFI